MKPTTSPLNRSLERGQPGPREWLQRNSRTRLSALQFAYRNPHSAFVNALFVAAALFAAPALTAATNDLTSALQKGLFEEEANRNLDAAIAAYQSLVTAFDKDRQIASTAVFRLGECYRKLGKTNEAVLQYERIVNEFSDQTTLATLSRQNLAGLGRVGAAGETSPTEGLADGSHTTTLESWWGQRALLRAQLDQARKETNYLLVAKLFDDDGIPTNLRFLSVKQSALEGIKSRPGATAQEIEQAERSVQQAERWVEVARNRLLDYQELRLRSLESAIQQWSGTSQTTSGTADFQQRLQAILERAGGGPDDSMQRLLLEAERERDEITVQLEQLKSLEPKEARLFYQQSAANPVMDSLMQRLAEAEQRQAEQLSNLGTEHPEVKRTEALIENIQKQIDAQMSAAITTLQFKRDAAERRAEGIRSLIAKTEATSPASGTRAGATPATDEEEQEIRRIQALIRNSPDLINARDNEGLTPLHKAAQRGQLSVAGFLLTSKADVDARSSRGNTALHLATLGGHKAMVELLLQHGADINAGDGSGDTALLLALRKQYQAVIDVLLAAKPDVNRKNTEGRTPLHAAVSTGQLPLVDKIIGLGADVRARDSNQRTALYYAYQKDVAELLLANKAEVDARDKNGWTPLHLMATGGNFCVPVIELLLQSGADINARATGGSTALHRAIEGAADEVMKALLKHKPNLDLPDPDGFTPLQRAYLNGKEDFVKLLLDAGANPNVAANALRGNTVNKMIGGTWTAIEQNGNTLLHWAVQYREDEIVAALLAHGANANATNQSGSPPLHTAAVNGNESAIKSLLVAKADVNVRAAGGWTPLHHAAINGRAGSAELLLQNKADPNARNDEGKTPLDFAKQRQSAVASGSPILLPPPYNRTIPPRPVQGAPGGGADASSKPQSIADLLRQHGALDDLPKLDQIQARCPSSAEITFGKGANDWNRFSLLELIACQYRLLSTSKAGVWQGSSGGRQAVWGGACPFPDFTRVTIHRPSPDGAKRTAIPVEADAILKSGDCARDVWLQWGDIVEIPEADHPVTAQWSGLSDEEAAALIKCVSRKVTIKIKGTETVLDLAPEFNLVGISSASRVTASFMLRSVLDHSKLLRFSSDVSRVKVTRLDPATGKKEEWVLDCRGNPPDFWLRDGDVIEVPEK